MPAVTVSLRAGLVRPCLGHAVLCSRVQDFYISACTMESRPKAPCCRGESRSAACLVPTCRVSPSSGSLKRRAEIWPASGSRTSPPAPSPLGERDPGGSGTNHLAAFWSKSRPRFFLQPSGLTSAEQTRGRQREPQMVKRLFIFPERMLYFPTGFVFRAGGKPVHYVRRSAREILSP